jgi:NAD(P)-dependent dehydrogenase (short-subunit alcohol dehydrogenase family)
VSVAPRVVVVTGASLGVGRATVRALAARGDSVALVARGGESLEAARQDVEARGARALALPTDVADADAVEAAATAVEDALGPIDVWINVAMASVFAPAWECTPAELRRVTDVTYLGAAYGTLAALRRMRPRDRGVIVQVGSALGYRAIPLQSAYCGAKHALRGFTDAVRCDLLHEGSGVRITSVHLPAMDTPQFDQVRNRLPRRPRPVAPVYRPEVAAQAILWASDHPRRELPVGHSTLLAILASKVGAAIADRYLARTAVDAQQTDEPDEPGRADNLDAPLPGDRGAHGRFGEEARATSVHLWLTTHRRALGGSALAAATAAVGARRLRR